MRGISPLSDHRSCTHRLHWTLAFFLPSFPILLCCSCTGYVVMHLSSCNEDCTFSSPALSIPYQLSSPHLTDHCIIGRNQKDQSMACKRRPGTCEGELRIHPPSLCSLFKHSCTIITDFRSNPLSFSLTHAHILSFSFDAANRYHRITSFPSPECVNSAHCKVRVLFPPISHVSGDAIVACSFTCSLVRVENRCLLQESRRRCFTLFPMRQKQRLSTSSTAAAGCVCLASGILLCSHPPFDTLP